MRLGPCRRRAVADTSAAIGPQSRNKPVQPPQVPKSAPFFLQSPSTATPEQAHPTRADTDTVRATSTEPTSRLLHLGGAPILSDFARALLQGAQQDECACTVAAPMTAGAGR